MARYVRVENRHYSHNCRVLLCSMSALCLGLLCHKISRRWITNVLRDMVQPLYAIMCCDFGDSLQELEKRGILRPRACGIATSLCL